MYILRIANLSKKYPLDNGEYKTVLDNVSLMLPSSGLIAIVGKSGSGKSTLLNMISLLDKPTSGRVYFMNENTEKWKRKRIEKYRNEDIGIVFQNYNLLENETAIFNIMLPALIGGKSRKEAEFAAKLLLNELNIDEKLWYQKCRDLSGGEKERIAILRSLVNDPKIVLADEPTGALDSRNSILVMEIFKKISEKRLVVFVTHNNDLVKKYANQVITIKDGKIKNDENIGFVEDNSKEKQRKRLLKRNSWALSLTKGNFKRRFKRNQFSMIGLIIGLVSTFLILGFSTGNKKSIKEKSYHQFNYGVATLYKETSQSIPGSKMALVQMSRLNDDDIKSIDAYLEHFEVEPNTDALLSPFPLISSGEEKLDELSYQPIYSFLDDYIDPSLLIEGELPQTENSFEVVINSSAKKYLKERFNSEVIGLELSVHSEYESHYYTNNSSKPVITDTFIYDKKIHIVGIVDDFYFLSTPKIYYSYFSFRDYLMDSLLINLSEYLSKDVDWYSYLLQSDSNDVISSYSHRLFLREAKDRVNLESYTNQIEEPYKLDSTPLIISQTLLDLMSAATMGMELFLAIALIGTALIMGIISISSYSEDRKTSAILTCLGASRDDIFSIYFYENLFISFLSLAISLVITPILAWTINKIVYHYTGFQKMVDIMIGGSFSNLLIASILSGLLVIIMCILFTYIPLFFSKKISPKEELLEE